ncbi:response regulator transcription factor [Mucilaginibacter gynuensis]|uniref:Response regulator transcription factor n=1 Tax=Mucilaginibacter gynuensis TaxID=1302236 RepID=A0ABP8FWU1_9SPHI
MQHLETLEEFYKRHPVPNQAIFSEDNTGQGHFNVFLRKPCKTRTPFSRRDFYKIALVIGKGKMIYADNEVIIDRPALVFSSPSVTSAWESGGGPQEGCFCLFTQAFIEQQEHQSPLQDYVLFKTGSSHIVFLSEMQLTFVSALMKKMMEEMNSDYLGKYDLLRNYLHILMHEALKKSPVSADNKINSASERITALFLDLLERQFPIDSPEQSLKLTAAHHYAQALAVHTNHLNRAVKEVTGRTTTSHITERVLKEANALLKHTDWSISQIAGGLGFDEPAYFTTFFKKHNGSTPVQARVGDS